MTTKPRTPPEPTPTAPVVGVVTGSLPSFRPVATDEIITVGGRTGIFTPLTGADASTSTENLDKVLDVLRAELAAARSENAELTARLAAAADPPRSADDLAEGIQSALDGLAERLATMSNPTSSFAVREFTLESKVHVDVTPLGTMGFQFVRPGDSVNAAALSTVTLTAVPIPKPAPDPGDAGAAQPAPMPSSQPVEAIDGLTGAQAAALRDAHVSTASAFARVATRATASARLMSLLHVDREALGRFTLLAGLLAVPGLDRLKAAVLYAGGIPDVATLATADPAALVTAYATAAATRADDDGWRPTLGDTRAWVEAARAMTAG